MGAEWEGNGSGSQYDGNMITSRWRFDNFILYYFACNFYGTPGVSNKSVF